MLDTGETTTEAPKPTGNPPCAVVYQVGVVEAGQLAESVTGAGVQSSFGKAETLVGGGGPAKSILAKILDLISASHSAKVTNSIFMTVYCILLFFLSSMIAFV